MNFEIPSSTIAFTFRENGQLQQRTIDAVEAYSVIVEQSSKPDATQREIILGFQEWLTTKGIELPFGGAAALLLAASAGAVEFKKKLPNWRKSPPCTESTQPESTPGY